MPDLKPYDLTLSAQIARDLDAGTFWSKIDTVYTHARTKHVGQSTSQLIDQMFDENKTGASTFMTNGGMKGCVEEAILSQIDAIRAGKAANKHTTFAIEAVLEDSIYQMPGDEVDFQTRNTGVARLSNGDIAEMSTDATAVILYDDDRAPYGFTLVSAFANINSPRAKPTGRDLMAAVHASRTYKDASPVLRTYLDESINKKRPYPIWYSKAEGTYPEAMSISIPTENPDVIQRIYMERLGMRMKTYIRQPNGKYASTPCTLTGESKRYVNLMDPQNFEKFKKQFPDAVPYVTKIRYAIDSPSDGQPQRERTLTPQYRRRVPDHIATHNERSDEGLEF